MPKREPADTADTADTVPLEREPNLSRRGALWRIFEVGVGVAGATLLTSGSTQQVAQARRMPPPVEPQRSLVSLELETPDGDSFPTFGHAGDRWAAGFEGERYNLRITNHTPKRVEIVVTVDGRDVISGRLGDYVKQRGYVLDPFDSLVVEGYRQSLDSVAAFRFSALGDSYTARMGTPVHAGVIGVAAFQEYELPHRRRKPLATVEGQPFPGEDAARPAPPSMIRGAGGRRKAEAKRSDAAASRGWAAPEDEAANELGTEYGESQFSPVEEVSFKRKRRKHPDQLLVLRYDSMDGLRARGVVEPPQPREPVRPWREPRWREPSRDFAPPPPPRRDRRWNEW
ncbi:hypothetical protein PPSIR1_26026 [Plesiocystis pacifica SIR-1]|uniref:Uncharacterized protein n=1 Tax=Plesiocystis pacifica SIR-1 TaxID=391625 RepID=A6GFQ0_9BACT|nr:hypothetical protein [Plesiocystis pacifica]EDM75301.1 hypothetical protein PPSIR1_26026 [Plesiocystis pacifica SIR-1]